MFFSWNITIPANTLESSPKTQRLKISKGVITRVDITFPPGCHGLVGVRLLRGESQLIPLSRGEWVTGNAVVLQINEYYELKTRPYSLKFVGHSEGTSYSHTVTVSVVVLPKNVASMMPLIKLMTKFFRRIGLIR